MKKYLIACGDSFTKGHLLGEKGSWAYHTAKKMNLQLINLAENGACNEWISSTLLLFLHKNLNILSDSVVMVGWTDFQRELLFYNSMYHLNKNQSIDDAKIVTSTITPADVHTDNEFGHQSYVIDNIIKKNKMSVGSFIGDEIVCLHKTYMSILHAKSFLDSKNVPYLFFDTVEDNRLYSDEHGHYVNTPHKKHYLNFKKVSDIPFIQNYTSKSIIDYIFSEPYVDLFEQKSIYGWLISLAFNNNLIYEVGNQGHTNELGADYVGNLIVKEYERIYNN